MNSRNCPYCDYNITVKIGKTSAGRQRYKCKSCHKTWTNKTRSRRLENAVWNDYVFSNMHSRALADKYKLSQSTIRRILDNYEVSPIEPPDNYSCTVICADVTYIGREYGFISILDAHTRVCLYCDITKNYETTYDYEKALLTLHKHGIYPKAVVVDGKGSVIKMFKGYGLHVQMCQFHMIRIMTRYLTRTPVLDQNKELRWIVSAITKVSRQRFEDSFYRWKLRNELWLLERYKNDEGKYEYSHQKTRTLVKGIILLLPYLYTFEEYPELKIPRTNNKIEGVHSALKSKLNIHRGAKKSLKTKIVFSFLSGRTGVAIHTI